MHISDGVVDENNRLNIFTVVNVLHTTPVTELIFDFNKVIKFYR